MKLTAGKTYVIELLKFGAASKLDPYVILHSPSDQKVAEDDDSGGNLNSRIRFMPVESGSYVITATSLSGGFGAYTLTVRESSFKKPR